MAKRYTLNSTTSPLFWSSLFENTNENIANDEYQFMLNAQNWDGSDGIDGIQDEMEEAAGIGNTINLMQVNGRRVLGPPENWLGPPPSSACELFVRRIPRSINEQKLLAPFLRFGRIYEIRLPVNFNHQNRGFAYVKYTNEEDASRAMEVLNHLFIIPRYKLEIMHSHEKCRLFVNNIPKHIDAYDIEQKLRSIFPTMQRVSTRSPLGKNADTNRSDKERSNINANPTITLGSNKNSSNNTNLIKYFTTSVKSTARKSAKGGNSSGNNNCEPDEQNCGHAFVEFASHLHALEAKKRISPGIVRLWNTDIKVAWDNNDHHTNGKKPYKTLFLRNIDSTASNSDIMKLLEHYVGRTAIRKVAKMQITAFVCFNTREAAEYCLRVLKGVEFRNRRLDVEWAKCSPTQRSSQLSRHTDFDALLRLKCIANNWGIPIIIFGAYYELQNVQYAAVMLRDIRGNVRSMICILNCNELNDIHSRLCEVACTLIETIGCFLDYNYIFYVDNNLAHLLGIVTISMQYIDFMGACGVPNEFLFDMKEIMQITSGIVSLSYISEANFLSLYMESFRNGYMYGFLNISLANDRVFGTIMPKYRNKPNLKYHINDTQVVLAYCFKSSGNNKFPSQQSYTPTSASVYDVGYRGLGYTALKLAPLYWVQAQSNSPHALSYVLFGGNGYNYPSQYVSVPQDWLTACSFFQSIRQPRSRCRDKAKIRLQLAISPQCPPALSILQ